jgi:hypothetical protein
MRRLVLVAMLTVAGCGGEDSVDGTWVAALGDVCAVSYTLDVRAQKYAETVLCGLADGATFGAQLERGTAVFTGNTITLTPRASSCPSSGPSASTVTYQVANGKLTLVAPGGAVVMSRPPKSSSDATVRFGCWDMGRFTDGKIVDL